MLASAGDPAAIRYALDRTRAERRDGAFVLVRPGHNISLPLTQSSAAYSFRAFTSVRTRLHHPLEAEEHRS